jgi:glycosyltransferase involved in cell wall biosynthesis
MVPNASIPAATAPDVSVVVPVYGSERTLPLLYPRVRDVFAALGRSFEIIFVDDGSRDRSWAELQSLHAADPERVVAIQLMRNFGQHNALMAGFHHARGAVIVTMDDDLQHPPEEIPKLISTLEAGDLDVVYGVYDSKKHATWRNAGSSLAIRFFQSIFQVSVTPTAFRAIRRVVIESILGYERNFTIIDGLLVWSTTRLGEVTVEHKPRAEGRSRYNLRKLLLQSMNLLTNFSLAPLQFVSLIGFVTAATGLALAAYYVVLYFAAAVSVPGYASLIVTLFVSSGLQMLSLGIIGEYLGRVLININQKPQFVERTVLSSARSSATAPRPENRSDVRPSD